MEKDKYQNPLPIDRLSENFLAKLNTEIDRMKAEGEDVIRMDVGSPDLPPANHILDALTHYASRVDSHGYQSHRGVESLRKAWLNFLMEQYHIVLEDRMVLPLIGSKEGVFHLSLAWLNPGDFVLVPDPGYQTYVQAARFAKAEPVFIPLLPQNGYLPDLAAVPEKVARKTKILWLNYPNNPTGAVATLDFFAHAVEFCHHYDILLCHDAAYLQVTFEDYVAPSIFQIPGASQVAVEFGSLSKAYNMAGWRVGFVSGHLGAIEALLKLKTHTDSGLFLPVMEAAVSALTGEQTWVKERNEIYRKRRDLMITGLQEMGLRPNIPQAAIYLWCQVPPSFSSETFVFSLLENTHVSVAPGSMFGPRGCGYIRISLTQPEDRIKQALNRMGNWLNAEMR